MCQSRAAAQPDVNMGSLRVQALDRNKCRCVGQEDIGDEGGGGPLFSLIAMTPSIGC